MYDNETKLYYLQSRYYNPELGRFLNADTILAPGQGATGNNAFVYCGNNPVVRRDSCGNAAETVWDIISLGFSLADVVANPTDPWAWAGLIGDAIDVAVPFLGGTGEIIRGMKAVADAIHAAESANALLNFTEASVNIIDNLSATLPQGDTCVYVAYKDNTLEYVGITNDFNRRSTEWKRKGRTITQITTYMDRTYAHYIEQTIIATFGKDAEGVLSNIRNSIGVKSSKYDDFVKFFEWFIESRRAL